MDPQTLAADPTFIEQISQIPNASGASGVLFLLMCAVLWFFYSRVWPFAVAQFEQRSKDIEKLLTSHDEDRKVYQTTISNMSDSLIKVDYRLGALEETTDKRLGAIETSITSLHKQVDINSRPK